MLGAPDIFNHTLAVRVDVDDKVTEEADELNVFFTTVRFCGWGADLRPSANAVTVNGRSVAVGHT
eukprot:5444911-Pyramimonas_sp.AAC.1